MDLMTSSDFPNYVKVQKDYIEMAKYYEGLKIHNDPGEAWILNEWMPQHASHFRESWNLSCCKICKNVLNCGHMLKKECFNFSRRV